VKSVFTSALRYVLLIQRVRSGGSHGQYSVEIDLDFRSVSSSRKPRRIKRPQIIPGFRAGFGHAAPVRDGRERYRSGFEMRQIIREATD
jgi:hypothetical protein